MTLVIACVCKQGILIATDGKAKRFYPHASHIQAETIETATKAFFLGKHVVVMPFGTGVENIEADLESFKASHDSINEDNKRYSLDITYAKKYLPPFFRLKYQDALNSTGEAGGFIVAGYEILDGKAHNPTVIGMLSGTNFKPVYNKDIDEFLAGGTDSGVIANKRFADVGKPVTRDVNVMCEAATEAIYKTADCYPDDVNKNVKMWLMTSDGYTGYSRDAIANSRLFAKTI